MAKYFDDTRKLPFPRVPVTNTQFSESWLKNQLASPRAKISLCFRVDGFPPDCLGYLFNIERSGTAFHISNITGKQLLTISTLPDLVAMILHVSGERYDERWQTEFQKHRQQITSD